MTQAKKWASMSDDIPDKIKDMYDAVPSPNSFLGMTIFIYKKYQSRNIYFRITSDSLHKLFRNTAQLFFFFGVGLHIYFLNDLDILQNHFRMIS
jgi:hypothetical protein